MIEKKFIYIPSFSAGVQGNYSRKDYVYKGIPARFWRNDYPGEPYKYFLLTAGGDLNRPECRKDFGLEDSLVFGDSGGYQICKGTIKWDLKVREKIFNWLENNSDIAMNLDIPPRFVYEGRIQECLEISKDNFKYFNEKQSGRTDFLNVLQGNNLKSYQAWYNEMKGFDFKGWAIGSSASSVHRFFAALTVLSKNKEFTKDAYKYIHILGTSKISSFIMLHQLQKSLEDVNNKLQVTTDSSTPNRSTAFGFLYVGYDLYKMSFNSIHLKRELFKGVTEPVPVFSSTSFNKILEKQGMTLNEVCDFTTDGYLTMVHHNLHLFLRAIDDINHAMVMPEVLREQLLHKDILWLCDILDKIIKDENPEAIFFKNEMRIKQIGNKLDVIDMKEQKITSNNSMFKIIKDE